MQSQRAFFFCRDTLGQFISILKNNKSFGNLFCNPQKSFDTSPGFPDPNNRGWQLFFKLNQGIYKKKKKKKKKKRLRLAVNFFVNAFVEFEE